MRVHCHNIILQGSCPYIVVIQTRYHVKTAKHIIIVNVAIMWSIKGPSQGNSLAVDRSRIINYVRVRMRLRARYVRVRVQCSACSTRKLIFAHLR